MSYYDLLRTAITRIKNDPEVTEETKTIILEKARKIYSLLEKLEMQTINIEEICGKQETIIDDKFTSTEEIYSILSSLYNNLLQCYRKQSYITSLLKSLYISSLTAALSSVILAINIQGLSIYSISAYAMALALITSGLSLYKYKLGAYAVFSGSLIALAYESLTLGETGNYMAVLAILILLVPLVTSFYIIKNKNVGLLIG
ncbi:MAG: hypothetical protein GSR79_04335 [Desulfurococcales archaeon]|nr:hypothetical protein [Desulfurococcales archaeon]